MLNNQKTIGYSELNYYKERKKSEHATLLLSKVYTLVSEKKIFVMSPLSDSHTRTM